MERYEKSLLEWWHERQHGPRESSFDAIYARLALRPDDVPEGRADLAKESPVPHAEPMVVRPDLLSDAFVRTPCACGNVVKATRQYIGRMVRCPNCGQSLRIAPERVLEGPPQANAPPSHGPEIRFACRCGRKIRVAARYAGRFGKCPQCGIRLQIPRVDTA